MHFWPWAALLMVISSPSNYCILRHLCCPSSSFQQLKCFFQCLAFFFLVFGLKTQLAHTLGNFYFVLEQSIIFLTKRTSQAECFMNDFQ